MELTWNRLREMIKDSRKREQVVKSDACQGFLHLHHIGNFMEKKLHFLPEVNIFSPIRPTIFPGCNAKYVISSSIYYSLYCSPSYSPYLYIYLSISLCSHFHYQAIRIVITQTTLANISPKTITSLSPSSSVMMVGHRWSKTSLHKSTTVLGRGICVIKKLLRLL